MRFRAQMTGERHLTESELAGYLDSDLAAGERARVEEHLEACDECRAEAAAVARLVHEGLAAGTGPPLQVPAVRRGWRLPLRVGGVAAAAAIAALLLWPAGPDVFNEPTDERIGSEGTVRLSTYSPRAGSTVHRDSIRFAWAGHDVSTYRITLTAENGALLWSQTVSDTTATPPAGVELSPGRTYFWYVDAIEFGVVARTGAIRFTVLP